MKIVQSCKDLNKAKQCKCATGTAEQCARLISMAAARTGVFHNWPANRENAEISFRCRPLLSVWLYIYMNCSALQNCADVGGGGQSSPVCCRDVCNVCPAPLTRAAFWALHLGKKINYSLGRIKVQSERFHYNPPSLWDFSPHSSIIYHARWNA